MIDLLQNAFVFFLFATPVLAAVVLLAGLVDRRLRPAILTGFIGIAIGFAIGVTLGGGFGQTEGWGWGNVGAAILGICYAATGFLIGFGAYSVGSKRNVGWLIVMAGLAFPFAHLGRVELQPAIAKSEMDWWTPILTNGSEGITVEQAKEHLSEPTKQALNEYIYRKDQIAPSTLRLLFHAGILVTDYVPLPSDLAQEIYAQNPDNIYLARNPSTPEEILTKLAQSNDRMLLKELSGNRGLPETVAEQLRTRFQSEIDVESGKSNPDWYTINTAKDALKALAKAKSGK